MRCTSLAVLAAAITGCAAQSAAWDIPAYAPPCFRASDTAIPSNSALTGIRKVTSSRLVAPATARMRK